MPQIDLGSVVGPRGEQGATGPQGEQGIQGIQGVPGAAGKTAYEAARDGGYTGTEEQFNAILAVMEHHASRHRTGGADALTAADIGALPRDGSAEMTGDLTITKAAIPYLNFKTNGAGVGRIFKNASATVDLGLQMYDSDANGNEVRLRLSASNGNKALSVTDNTTTYYPVFHTGNKPSDSYNGDGNATAENLCAGATGNMAIICGNGKFTVVTENGGVCSDGTTLTSAQVKFSGGTLTVSTNDERVNKLSSPVTKYYWQVL